MAIGRKRRHIFELPSEVLANIVARLSREDRLCSVALVCKLTRRICDEAADLQITTEHLNPGFVEWFRKRAHTVRELLLTETDVLGFQEEQSVVLTASLAVASTAAGGGLRLFCVLLDESRISLAILTSFSRGSQLEALLLRNIDKPSPAICVELGHMQNLQLLSLEADKYDGKEDVDLSYTFWNSVAKLPRLRILALSGMNFLKFIEPAQGVPAMPQLRALLVNNMRADMPSDLSCFSGLRLLHFSDVEFSWKLQFQGPTWHIWQLANLQKFSFYQELELNVSEAQSAIMFPRLLCPAGLKTLDLELAAYPNSKYGYRFAGWDRMLQSAKHSLRSLHLASAGLCTIPHCMTQLDMLEVLDLVNNSLSSLPEGPYLAKLATLDLGHNKGIVEVPTALRHCTSLKMLGLYSEGLTVIPPEGAGILAGLPVLRALELSQSAVDSCNNQHGTAQQAYAALKGKMFSGNTDFVRSNFREDDIFQEETSLKAYECTNLGLIRKALRWGLWERNRLDLSGV